MSIGFVVQGHILRIFVLQNNKNTEDSYSFSSACNI